jgi:hypothetical protein
MMLMSEIIGMMIDNEEEVTVRKPTSISAVSRRLKLGPDGTYVFSDVAEYCKNCRFLSI